MIKTLSPQDFSSLLTQNQKIFVLDVRTDIECKTEKLRHPCVHIPLHQLDGRSFKEKYAKIIDNAPIYILCRSGARATKAAYEISAFLSNDIFIVGEGLQGCVSCGVPTQKQKTISLERQVRIAAGLFVVTGTFLGFALHPLFYLLSGIIGMGLIYAGITDKCGMALVLAHAPWNKKIDDKDIRESVLKFEEKTKS